MADLQVLIEQEGPLPINVTAMIESDGPCALTLSGSVWTNAASSMIGVALLIDNQPAAQAQIYSNSAATHRAVVPVTFSHTFEIGKHKFTLMPLNENTLSDPNDVFNLSVLY